MKKESLLVSIALLFCLNLTSCVSSGDLNKNEIELNENRLEAGDTSNTTVTIGDMAKFLENRKEHYPFSDEFIEKYQQASGGYIDNARKAGLIVDKQLHEPNQKWHFFESWLYPSIEDGSLSMEEEAKSRVYNKLLCPELLLWIYEASNVSPSKVRAAMKVAEEGKVAKTHISTVAKNMRQCVPWEDIEQTVLNYEYDEDDNNTNTDNPTTYSVKVNEINGFTISGLQSNYQEGAIVSFVINVTDSTKEISEVKANNEILKSSNGTYMFTMPSSDVIIYVTLKDASIDTPSSDFTSVKYNIKYDLGSRVTAKIIETTDELYNTFEVEGENNIISAISQMEYMYGGAYGGSGENKWYTGDIIKFGTTSVNGNLTFALNTEVNSVKITGYVSNSSCKIQIGDSSSSDWGNEASDNKTITYDCTEMNVTTKEIVESKQTSTITLDFASTKNLKIATINKKPFYIASIEFIKK